MRRGRRGRTVDLGEVDASRAVWLGEDRLLVFGRRGLGSLALEVSSTAARCPGAGTTDGSVGELYHPSGAALGDGIAALTSSHRRPPVHRRRGRDRHRARGRGAPALRARGRARGDRAPRGAPLDLDRRPRDRRVGDAAARGGPFPLVARRARRPDRERSDDGFPAHAATHCCSRAGSRSSSRTPRGSTGRGQGLSPERVVGDMGGLDVDDVLTGVDAAVAAGLADPDRLVLTGGATAGSWPRGSRPATRGSRRRYRSRP